MEARQSQTQKLAPKMIQSMEILQLPILALQERIDQEMNENPMLELDEPEPVAADEEPEAEPPKTREAEVVDIMALLKRSVEQQKQKQKPAARGAKAAG
jgi:DNA-directed RNA polymerase specialized sigma54-like protein